MNARRVKLGSAQIFRSIDIQKPPRRGKQVRIGNLAALNQRFDWQHRHLLTRARSGNLEPGKTAPAPRFQFPFQHRKG